MRNFGACFGVANYCICRSIDLEELIAADAQVPNTCYDLIANIVYDGDPNKGKGSYRVHILHQVCSVVTEWINIFCLRAIMSAVSGYWHISLIAMGGIAYNERILRDIRNLINVSLFWLFFVHSLYIYRCFALCRIQYYCCYYYYH